MEDYENNLDSEGKRLLNIIRENIHKIGQLIDDILLLSCASHQEMKFREVDMEELVKRVFEEQKSSSQSQNVHLKLENKVKERTEELQEANEELKIKIIRRKELEEALQKSEKN